MNTKRNAYILIAISFILLLSLSACGSGEEQVATTPDPLESTNFNPVVSVTGEVLPVQWATLSAETNGSIDALHVEVGDRVEQGDLLVTMSGRAALQAAVTAAELELVQAQQALDELKEGADMARADAQQELADAKDALDDAEYMYRVRQKGNRASQATIDAAEARLLLAEKAVDRAKANYDKYSGRDSESEAKAIALRRLANARIDRDSALRSLNWYNGEPTEIDQALLDADVAVSQARVDEAERMLARMENGPDIRKLAAAEARLENAEAQLAAAQATLDDAELRAPFAGTISEVYVRAYEWVPVGTPLIDIGDLANYRIHTTDLNEIDAARVQVGDSANITYDAAPDFEGVGVVTEIAPKPSSGGGVNYTAILETDDIPEAISWGMTAFVDIEVQE